MLIIKQAVEVLKIETEDILKLAERIDDNFSEMVELICRSKGRLILSGIGKSGLVGRKIVATLNSTGTRSLFLHPAEAMHGDLGIVGSDDIFIAPPTAVKPTNSMFWYRVSEKSDAPSLPLPEIKIRPWQDTVTSS